MVNRWAENPFAAMCLPAAMAGQRDAHVTVTPGLYGDDSILVGGAGNDLIIGGQGRDILVGGFGSHEYNDSPATDSGASEARDHRGAGRRLAGGGGRRGFG